MVPLIANDALYCTDTILFGNESLNGGHKQLFYSQIALMKGL